MAIRKHEANRERFEKDIFAISVEGKISTVVVKKEIFSIVGKESQISDIDRSIVKLQEEKIILQADIDVANIL